ncbi:MAG TPA: LamG domain-containing protein, partial [Actinopolymorphaceae bacterium]|nr:LamG domain-containing protein [Actinopolymorphaceae bacterium]
NAHLPLNTWSHLAVTLSGTTATVYINGVAAGSNPNVTLHPSDLGNTNQNWIARSQYGDPFLPATVDDFAIYSRALSAAEVATLAGGTAATGDVADYKFDEDSGATATDSSGNGKDATIISLVKPTITCPGKVFLQKDLTTGNLVCWKDQQNFAPFIDGIAPDDANHVQALRYYADKAEFPIMPSYTANQADTAADEACEACSHGSNNFSNINATLQARLYSEALRHYPSQYITPDMYRQLIEWLSWNEDINGDNRFPDNNEFFFNWDPATQTLGRSGIHHDVLGSYNWMMFQDVAGLQPRLDDKVELWPIDMGYDHFTVNNMNYHGSNVTIVWQKPGGARYYPMAPVGYSLYVDGRRALTVDDLAHVQWDSESGRVTVLDGSHTRVLQQDDVHLMAADQVGLGSNARVVDSFSKAGVDLTHPNQNLAAGKTATASFTTTTPASQATDPANAVDGFTISGLPVTQGAYVGTNPIWGDQGSPNAQDWLQVNLGKLTTISNAKVFFYSNKAFGAGGNTYREPASYTLQYLRGSTWVDLPHQAPGPATPAPNLNALTFSPVVTSQIRLVMTRATGFAVGVKEIQVFR